MKKKPWLAVLAALTVVGALSYTATRWVRAAAHEHAWQRLSEQNVPPRAGFDRLLRRDLSAFFRQSSGQSLAVEPTLLSSEPSQGARRPEFWVWVRLARGKKPVGEGLARVQADSRTAFRVQSFESRAQLLKGGAGDRSEARLREKFPPQVAVALAKYLGS